MIEGLRIGLHRQKGRRQVWIVSVSQGRHERVPFHFAREVIAAGAHTTGAENRTSREFPLQVEIILQRVGKLRMIRRRENIYRLCQKSITRVEKGWKDKG